MKKVFTILLCVCICFSFSACNKKENNDKDNTPPTSDTDSIENEEIKEEKEETITPEGAKEPDVNQNITSPKPVTKPTLDYGSKFAYNQLMALDNKSNGYGQGTAVDDKNRPTGAMNVQNKYGKYDFYCIMPESKNIYLTFDLGYEYEKLTLNILDTLKAKNVKAIFFVTKSYCKNKWHDNTAFVRRIIDEGHVLGNHTLNHPHTPTLSLENMHNELMGMHDYIKTNFGYEMSYYRPPYGEYSERSLALAQSLGYKSFNWSFAYYDYDTAKQPDRTEALNKMVDSLHPGAIYLLHAVSRTNAEVLGEFIDKAQEKGYTFVTGVE